MFFIMKGLSPLMTDYEVDIDREDRIRPEAKEPRKNSQKYHMSFSVRLRV